MARKRKIGLALGSGGARGWCHLGVLSVLDEMGITPDIIVGSSMGSVVGAAEAGGVRAQLQDWALELTQTKFFGLVDIKPMAGGLIAGREIAGVLAQWGLDCGFSDLQRPFTAIATDLENGREVWLREGPLLPAVRASLSIPGLFTPQYLNGHWLIDGGLTNPVPVSVARAQGADVIIAVNPNAKPDGRVWHPRPDEAGLLDMLEDRFGVSLPDGWRPKPEEDGPPAPQSYEVVNAAIDMMMEYLRRTRMAADPADVMLNVELPDFTTIEYYRAEAAIAAGRAAAEAAGERIERAMAGFPRSGA